MAASQASSAVPNGNGYETGSSAFEVKLGTAVTQTFGRWVVFQHPQTNKP